MDGQFSDLHRKIAFSTLVQYAGKIIQLFLAAMTIKLVSNFLSQGEYGLYAKISEYALFFSVVANLGLFGNVIKKMSGGADHGHVFVNALMLRITTAFVLFLTGFLIAYFSRNDSIFVTGLFLFFTFLLFDYITSICDAALQANYLMGRATFALILGRLVSFLATYFLVRKFLTQNDNEAVLYFFMPALLGSVVTALLSIYFVSRRVKFNWSFDRNFMWQVFITSLPFGIINIVNNLYFRFLPDFLTSNYSGLGNSEFATFNISFKIAQVLSLFSTFLMLSALPGLKSHISKKQWHKVNTLYKRLLWILLLSGALMFIAGSLFGADLVELLTHKKYFLPQFWFLLPMMLFLAAVSYGYDLVLITLFAMEKDGWFLKREFLALCVAGVFFMGSFAATAIELKLILILLGAIGGELTMVLLSLHKIHRVVQSELGEC